MYDDLVQNRPNIFSKPKEHFMELLRPNYGPLQKYLDAELDRHKELVASADKVNCNAID